MEEKGKDFHLPSVTGGTTVLRVASLESRLDFLEKQVQAFMAKENETIKDKVAITSYEDMKVAELKALCLEKGIDVDGFPKTNKKPYIEALTKKD